MNKIPPLIYAVQDENGTELLGKALADFLPSGLTISMSGTLGAGKTRLVQAVAEASGVQPETVSSPTFVLIREYIDGKRPIYHFDAYRLKDEDEFMELGPDEYFEGQGLTFVEWGDRVETSLPENRLNLQIDVLSENKRRFELSWLGSEFSCSTISSDIFEKIRNYLDSNKKQVLK